MTLALLLLVFLSESCSVGGQLLMKHAMTPADDSRGAFLRIMTAAIVAKALAFFLWLFLLGHFDLSYLYPFEGLNCLMIAIGASVFLKEKISPSLWLGVLLITIGVGLVSAT